MMMMGISRHDGGPALICEMTSCPDIIGMMMSQSIRSKRGTTNADAAEAAAAEAAKDNDEGARWGLDTGATDGGAPPAAAVVDDDDAAAAAALAASISVTLSFDDDDDD